MGDFVSVNSVRMLPQVFEKKKKKKKISSCDSFQTVSRGLEWPGVLISHAVLLACSIFLSPWEKATTDSVCLIVPDGSCDPRRGEKKPKCHYGA